MQPGAHEAECLVQLGLVTALPVAAGKLNAFAKETTNMQRAGHDIDSLIRNVVLHSRLGVDGQLNTLVHRTTKSAIILTSVLVLRIPQRIINVVFLRKRELGLDHCETG